MRRVSVKYLTARAPGLVELVEIVALVGFVVSAVLALAVAIVPAAEPPVPAPAAPAAPAPAMVDSFAVTADSSVVFVLEAGNRMYPDWKEEHRVKLHESFGLGDTDNSAVVTMLLPDFRIVDNKPRSMSAQLNNPAARIFVYQKGAAVDSAWAFLNFPPHFSPKSFFTFQLTKIMGYPRGGSVTPPAAPAAEHASPAHAPTGDE